MDFKIVPKKYRPIPFWSWNEKLNTEETKRQVYEMNQAGMGGFFMHARGGLQTEYMGEAWFDNVSTSIEAAEECDMRPWAYDENGWPSGFGNGAVNGLGIEYQQKYLRMEVENTHPEMFICTCGGHSFYYDVNPFYVDTLDKKVIAKFIACTYEPYFERYGNRVEGFFTDEPQISRNGIPWSFVFEEEYQNRYSENIFDYLEQLFLPVGDYKRTRVKFWKMVTDLFSEAYMKQIYDWCEAHGYKLTGHLACEGTLIAQLTANGACMPHYEYMHIPGVDWLGRNIKETLLPLQLSSVAEQLGKKAVLTESFALCGHNVSFGELKGICEWQMVRGINLLCQHLEGYSLRGIRKRDYPPAMYLQQPWWSDYDKFNEAMARVGMLLREGEPVVDVLVLHPQTTAWALYDDDRNEGLQELNDRLLKTMKALEQKHIPYHLGDETMMERHGHVQDGKLVIEKQAYRYVVNPGCEILLEHTEKLLAEFEGTGGHMVSVEQLQDNLVIDNPRITYTRRKYTDFTVHYFVNTSANYENAYVSITGEKMDIYTGGILPFDGKHTFEPWGSLVVVERIDKTANVPEKATSDATQLHISENSVAEVNYIRPDGIYKILSATENSLTLDRCDYYFDGKLQEQNGYVLNICERANALERPVKIHQDYFVQADYVPQPLYLVCETPQKFMISVNDTIIEGKTDGYFRDKSFQKIEISQYMKQGKNKISFECNFSQSDAFYENMRKARVFESEKNKLAYDMEIEAVYLTGDFSVKTDGAWTKLDKDAVRYHGEFILDKPKTEVELVHLEKQGYPFFSGELVVEGVLDISGEHPVLKIDRKGINVVRVEINGMEKTLLADNLLELKPFGAQGVTKVRFTLINNLRNLLGPHHVKEGECYSVVPGDFYKEACVWNENPDWEEEYCFVETGV